MLVVVGCGGTFSHMAPFLLTEFRGYPVSLVDPDWLTEENLFRQWIMEPHEGIYKVDLIDDDPFLEAEMGRPHRIRKEVGDAGLPEAALTDHAVATAMSSSKPIVIFVLTDNNRSRRLMCNWLLNQVLVTRRLAAVPVIMVTAGCAVGHACAYSMVAVPEQKGTVQKVLGVWTADGGPLSEGRTITDEEDAAMEGCGVVQTHLENLWAATLAAQCYRQTRDMLDAGLPEAVELYWVARRNIAYRFTSNPVAE